MIGGWKFETNTIQFPMRSTIWPDRLSLSVAYVSIGMGENYSSIYRWRDITSTVYILSSQPFSQPRASLIYIDIIIV